MKEFDILILGAGIGGLSLAHRLQSQGLKVAVIDRNENPGGVISSSYKEQYQCEFGPNTVLLKNELRNLVKELSLEQLLVKPSKKAKKRFICQTADNGKRKMTSVPLNPLKLASSSLLSASAKFRLLAAVVPRRRHCDDESVQRFMSRHLGKEFTNSVVAPGLSGVWAADITQLSARSCLPNLWKLEKDHGSLFLGLAKTISKRRRKAKPEIVSFGGGLQTLTDALSRKLGGYYKEHSVEQIERLSNGSWSIKIKNLKNQREELVESTAVVLTSGQSSTAKLIKDFAPKTAKTIARIPSSSVGILHLAYNKKAVRHPLDGFGCLFDPQEQQPLLGAIFNSSLFPHTAPPDKHLITCFMGGALNPENFKISEQQCRDKGIETLGKTIGALERPVVVSGVEWPNAIPNYPLGHHRIVTEVKNFEFSNPGIFCHANWLKGLSLNDRVAESEALANRLLVFLQSRRASYQYKYKRSAHG